MKGKKEIAKTNAKLVELEKASSDDAIVLNNSASGAASVSQFRFAGKKTAIALDSADRASMSNPGSK